MFEKFLLKKAASGNTNVVVYTNGNHRNTVMTDRSPIKCVIKIIHSFKYMHSFFNISKLIL